MLMRTPIEPREDPPPKRWQAGSHGVLIAVVTAFGMVAATLALTTLFGGAGRTLLTTPGSEGVVLEGP